jgi:uncharacterized protein YcgI (DUF1989 family)
MSDFELSRALHVPGLVGTVPATQGLSVFLREGEVLTVVNTHGSQVVDTWAFNSIDPREFMSMEHSRASMLRVTPGVGDALVTNRRRPILRVVEDTSGGVHDTLIAACDRHRYLELGADAGHANCSDNLARALHELGWGGVDTPCPLNLFMNVNIEGGRVEFLAPVSKPGQSVSMRAEMDQLVVMSACPQDITPVNALRPTDVHFQVSPAHSSQ